MGVLESGFQVKGLRKNIPWYNLGTPVNEAPTSEDAIRLAGIDWNVYSKPIFIQDDKEEYQKIPQYIANVRDIDNCTLGIVTGRYTIVQNADAFSFTDNLISQDVQYESAGAFANGKRVWLLAKLPETLIAGETIVPYVAFTNSHDGKGSIRVSCIPIQIRTSTSLNFAIPTAPRMWTAKHLGKIEEKIEEAHRTLEMTQIYLENLSKMANQLMSEKITESDLNDYINELMPLPSESEERRMENVENNQKELEKSYRDAEYSQFFGTKWGFLNAVSNYVNHTSPKRYSAKYAENQFARIIDGHWLIDRAFEIVTKK